MVIRVLKQNKTGKAVANQRKPPTKVTIEQEGCDELSGYKYLDRLSSQYLSVCLSVYPSIPPPPHLGEECSRQMLRSWCRSTGNLCDGVIRSLREKRGRRWGQRRRKVTVGGGWLQDPEDGEGSWGEWHLTRVKRPYLCFDKVTLTGMWREGQEQGDQLRKPLQNPKAEIVFLLSLIGKVIRTYTRKKLKQHETCKK